jgi:rubrerythrin
MKKSIKGTKTEKNLMVAFASESMAVSRYICFAETARLQGYERAAVAFMDTAESEKAHAGMFIRLFEGGAVEITATYPSAPPGDTKSNLDAAIEGENGSWKRRYPEFSKTAREEGLADIAALFEKIGADEKHHEERFNNIRDNLEQENETAKRGMMKWLCTNCGYVVESMIAPAECPSCRRSQPSFEMLAESY